jgi:hypothetical protein
MPVQRSLPVKCSTTNLPWRRESSATSEDNSRSFEFGSDAAYAAGAPKDNPETIVAAASPAAPMDLKAVEALFL